MTSWPAWAATMGSDKPPKNEEEVDDSATELYEELDLEELPDAPPVKPRRPMLAPRMLDLDVDLGAFLEEDADPELTLPLPDQDAAWRRLHPASLVVNLIPRTFRVIWGFWPLMLLMLVGGSVAGGPDLTDLGFVLIFMFTGMWSTFIHFLTLRYRIFNGKVEIKQGLLSRQARTIDPARIQNVGLVRNPFHRLSGLVEVRLETAGDVRTEGLLSALSVRDATRFMQQLAALRGKPVAQTSVRPVLKLGLGELLAYGLSKPSAGYVVVLLLAITEVAPILSPGNAARAIEEMQPGLMAGLLLLAFVASWVGTAMLSIVRHYGFTLTREGLERPADMKLRAREGLLTTREVEIPLRKVQLAVADEPLMRRWMGFGTVSVETAGLGSLREGVQAAELVVPMVDRDELNAIVRSAIPRNTVDPWRFDLKPAHPRALWRLLFGSVVRSTLIAVPLSVFFWPMGLVSLALFPLGLLSAWLDYRYQGWLITPEVVIARRGFWRRTTAVLARDKLQSVHLVQGPLMRGYGLGRVVLRVAGSQVVLPDLGFEDAATLLERLRPNNDVVSYR